MLTITRILRLLRRLLSACVFYSFRLLPIRSDYLVFESEGDFCDNPWALFEYIRKKDTAKKLIWIVSDPSKFVAYTNENCVFCSRSSTTIRGFITFCYYVNRASTFFFSHPFWLKRWRTGQTIVNLWHGIPLKQRIPTSKPLPFSVFPAPTQFTADLLQKFFLCDESKTVFLGFPRNDLLYQRNEETLKCLLPKWEKGNRIFICMPTYRSGLNHIDGQSIGPYSINSVTSIHELNALNEFLKTHQAWLIVKVHHLQTLNDSVFPIRSNIMYIQDNDLQSQQIQLYSLLAHADALLTDYSSVYFDYLLLNRPIGFLIHDLAEYKRGFIVEDPLELMPGALISKYEELIAFLKSTCEGYDRYQLERESLCSLVYGDNRRNSCAQVYHYFVEGEAL